MHEELDRLRRELKQKIFVGEPGGETFVTAAPERVLETKRERLEEARAEPAAPARRPTKKSPMTLDDY